MIRPRTLIPWRIEAIRLLDAHAKDPDAKPLTQAALAEKLGIARQTLWRDDEIKARVKSLNRLPKRAKRKDKDVRIIDLETRNSALKEENGLLLKNLIVAARNLRSKGMDPGDYFAECIFALETAFPGLTGQMLYDDLKTPK